MWGYKEGSYHRANHSYIFTVRFPVPHLNPTVPNRYLYLCSYPYLYPCHHHSRAYRAGLSHPVFFSAPGKAAAMLEMAVALLIEPLYRGRSQKPQPIAPSFQPHVYIHHRESGRRHAIVHINPCVCCERGLRSHHTHVSCDTHSFWL